jgi:hypothetical protein
MKNPGRYKYEKKTHLYANSDFLAHIPATFEIVFDELTCSEINAAFVVTSMRREQKQ